MGRQVVVEEELTSHEEEWEVVSGPGQPEEAGRVVQPGTSAFYRELERVKRDFIASGKEK